LIGFMDNARIGSYFYESYDNQWQFGNRIIDQSTTSAPRYAAESTDTRRY
jgi:hypothetical protein